MVLETTIKVSRDFRRRLKQQKKIGQSYQQFLEEHLPNFLFDNQGDEDE